MAYRFKRKETLKKAVRRIGCEQLDGALECLEDCRHVEAIHCARKEIKRVRAVLRLVRCRIRKNKFRRVALILRESAGKLAAARDAYVKAQTVRKLAHHFNGQLSPRALRNVRAELHHSSKKTMLDFAREKTARSVGTKLRRGRKAIARLKVKGRGWNAIGPGMKWVYRDGRRAYRRAQDDPLPENFHRWRKRAKDLWYQVRLLENVWPEQMDAMASELETLGELLGDSHDLAVLQEEIEQHGLASVHPRERETLSALVEERQKELRAAALTLGARLYAEKPSMFCDRVAGYWRIWRHRKKAPARAESPSPE
jgi:CHAD domain-containing protein